MQRFFRSPTNSQYQQTLQSFRAQFFPWLLVGTAVLALIYLAGWAAALYTNPQLPWDGLFVLGLCGFCALLLRRQDHWGLPLASALFVAGVSQPIFYAMQSYGVKAAATAVLALTILLAGLFIGGWFLTLWTGFLVIWVIVTAVQELTGARTPPNPIASVPELVGIALFWGLLLLVTGILAGLIVRNLEQQLQLAHGQRQALSAVLDALTSSPDLKTIVRQALLALGEQLAVAGVTIFFFDAETEALRPYLFYVQGEIQEPAQANTPDLQLENAANSPLWQALQTSRQPIVVNDAATDPRLHFRDQIAADGIQKILLVPLLLGDQLLGHVSLNRTTDDPFWSGEIELARVLAQQVTLGVRVHRLAQEVAAQAGETAVISERNRMAREIHDTLAQGFTGILVQLAAAEDALELAPDESRPHLARAKALAQASLDEARRSVWALRPEALAHNDLPHALARRLAQLTDGAEVQATFTTTGVERPLPPALETELLRIAQEAVANTVKHAQATAVAVTLAFAPQQVTLTVRDNGRGFDPDQATAGFGLTSMRERAQKVNGRLAISASPGGGATVRCIAPIPA